MATASCSAPLRPPRLLKDFLQDQITTPIVTTTTPRKTRLIHKVTEVFINAVKFQLPAFKSVKRPPTSILPRSISRRLSRSRKPPPTETSYYYDDIIKEVSITVKVKDILRWKSSRDLQAEDNCPAPEPLDLAAANSPSRCTTVTTATETSASSGRSSWCDSDFTAEDLPSSWCGTESINNGTEVKISEKYLAVNSTVGSTDLVGATTGKTSVHLQGELSREEEEESYTPVSILDFSFHEDEESVSPFHQAFSKPKRRRFTPKRFFKEFEVQDDQMEKQFIVDEDANAIEEKASKLVECVIGGCDDDINHHLLLDFFRHELITSGDPKSGHEFDGEVYLRVANAWFRGEDEDGSLEWEMEGKREVCVREMDRRERWNKFDEEQKEMTMEIENEVLNSLLDELLIDLVCH